MSSKSRSRSTIRPMWWLVVLLLATMAVWQRYTIVRLGAEVEVLQGEIVQLERARDELLVETAVLSARDRIEGIARSELGLEPTQRAQRQTLSLPQDMKTGIEQSAGSTPYSN